MILGHTFCQLAGALAEEGCSLDQIVSKVTEILKGIGESPFLLTESLAEILRCFRILHCGFCCRYIGGESFSVQRSRLPAFL